jgi:ATP-binding cassette subfamily B protein RaxB
MPAAELAGRLGLRFGFGRQLPVILQAEAAECGLACLAMVAGYHGQHSDLPSLRRRFSMSLKGVDLPHLIEIAAAMGLQGRPVKLDLEDIGRLRTPCILHWDMNHFVVLESFRRNRVRIHDPRRGTVELRLADLSSHFTGVALELSPTADFRLAPSPPSVTLSQLAGPVRGLPSALSKILLLSLSLQVFSLLAPFYMQWVIDQVLVTGDGQLLTLLGVGIAMVLAFQVVTSALRSWSVTYLSASVGVQWTSNVFGHLLRLPMEFFEKRDLGDVTSRMGSVQSIQRTLSTTAIETLIDGLMAMVTLGLMLMYSVKLAAITLVGVALYYLLRRLAFQPLKGALERQMVSSSRQQTFLLESLRGVQSLKLGCRENVRSARFQNLIVDTTNQELRTARMNLSFNVASQLTFGLERIAVIWVGAYFALRNEFSIGMLIAYLAYREQFSSRISSLIDKAIELRMLRLHGERLGDVVLTAPEASDLGLAQLPGDIDCSLSVRSLSFRYADGEPWVVRDCSFDIAPGESVAIVGASGCGKTTLVKLLLGLLGPESGRIELGGHDVSRLAPSTYRSLIGTVMQDDQLFAGSIADNISFGDVRSEPARIEAAARLAAIHEEISAMPMGYHSLIGDMGSTLSGGQKQRVILARALYREPKILFLDEATSHLDMARERQVNEAIAGLKITKLIIAHRSETIASADRVLVMRDGRIAEGFEPGQPARPHWPERASQA